MRMAEKWMYRTIKGSKFYQLLLRVLFTCDIPQTAQIGERVQLCHNGMGVVIHDQAVIGDDCVIFQHVPIGGNGKIVNGVTTHGATVLERGVTVFAAPVF